MPNWCENTLSISGSPDRIVLLWDAIQAGRFFAFVKPEPDYDDDTAWYGWRCDNWNTKWEISEEDAECFTLSDDQTNINGSINTAWSPPIGIYKQLVADGFDVIAKFFEPGMVFFGVFENGEHTHWDIPDFQSKNDLKAWIAQNVSDDLWWLEEWYADQFEDADDPQLECSVCDNHPATGDCCDTCLERWCDECRTEAIWRICVADCPVDHISCPNCSCKDWCVMCESEGIDDRLQLDPPPLPRLPPQMPPPPQHQEAVTINSDDEDEPVPPEVPEPAPQEFVLVTHRLTYAYLPQLLHVQYGEVFGEEIEWKPIEAHPSPVIWKENANFRDQSGIAVNGGYGFAGWDASQSCYLRYAGDEYKRTEHVCRLYVKDDLD